MWTLEADIVKRGHEYATLDSSPNAVGFYINLGYVSMGPPNDDGALPMRKVFECRTLELGPPNRALQADERRATVVAD